MSTETGITIYRRFRKAVKPFILRKIHTLAKLIMNREQNKLSPRSLFDLSMHRLALHLNKLQTEDFGYLEAWPNDLKNILLKKYLSARRVSVVNFNQILSVLLNKNTVCLDLPCHTSDEDIAVLKKSPNLKKLIMSKNISNITSSVLVDTLQHLHCLKVVVLPQSRGVNDDVIKCLADNCPDLVTVDLTGCVGITDDGIIHLGKCENLLHVALARTQIGDRGIIAVVQGNSGKKLVEVRINDCPNIGDNGLIAVLKHCIDIEILHVTNTCSAAGEVPEFFEAVNLRNLKQLTWSM